MCLNNELEKLWNLSFFHVIKKRKELQNNTFWEHKTNEFEQTQLANVIFVLNEKRYTVIEWKQKLFLYHVKTWREVSNIKKCTEKRSFSSLVAKLKQQLPVLLTNLNTLCWFISAFIFIFVEKIKLRYVCTIYRIQKTDIDSSRNLRCTWSIKFRKSGMCDS